LKWAPAHHYISVRSLDAREKVSSPFNGKTSQVGMVNVNWRPIEPSLSKPDKIITTGI